MHDVLMRLDALETLPNPLPSAELHALQVKVYAAAAVVGGLDTDQPNGVMVNDVLASLQAERVTRENALQWIESRIQEVEDKYLHPLGKNGAPSQTGYWF